MDRSPAAVWAERLVPPVIGALVFVVLIVAVGRPATQANAGLICVLLAAFVWGVASDLISNARDPSYSPIGHIVAVFAIPLAAILAANGHGTSWIDIWWLILLCGALIAIADVVVCGIRASRTAPATPTDEQS